MMGSGRTPLVSKGLSREDDLARRDRIAHKKEPGLSGAEIARHLGVNTTSINHALAMQERLEERR